MLNITRFVVNNFSENTYLAVDKATQQGAIIDPGMLYDEERDAVSHFIKENGITLTQIILTHAHLDHCFGVDYVKTKFGVPVKGHKHDASLAAALSEQGRRFGMGNVLNHDITFDVELKDGDVIEIGESTLEVIHVPGHSAGGIVLYDREDGIAFVGDSIFRGSIGRTDLEGGNFETLINSLRTKVLSLPDETRLLPGHDATTTVGDEKQHNPFLK